MKLYLRLPVLFLAILLLTGCAGAYGPELPEQEVQNSYSEARRALDRAKQKEAPERAKEKYGRAAQLFEEGRRSLEELPTSETVDKFKQARAQADLAVIEAQEVKIAEQDVVISTLEEQIAEYNLTVEELKNEIEEQESRITEQNFKLADLHHTEEKLKDEIAVLEDSVALKTASLARERDTIAAKKTALEKRGDTIAKLETEILELNEQLQEVPDQPPEKIIAGQWLWEKMVVEELDTTEPENIAGDTIFYRTDVNLTFDTGKFQITNQHRQQLEKLTTLKHLPDHQLLAVGSTDELAVRGNREFETNRELSLLRALNAVEALIENHDFKADNMAMMGVGEYGDFKPGFEQLKDSEKRRVEFWLIPLEFFEDMPEI